MGSAAGEEAYFQRGSWIWFAVITLSFGYYTVKARRGVSTPFCAGFAPAGEDRPRKHHCDTRALGTAGEGTRHRKKILAHRSARAFRRNRLLRLCLYGGGAGTALHPTVQCLDLSRWWRSRRPARLLPPTSVQPDPCPLWSRSWGWDTSR